MEYFLKVVLKILPLIFGIGFLAPVIAQGLQAVDIGAPFGLGALMFGLIIGGAWGLFATLKGRWI